MGNLERRHIDSFDAHCQKRREQIYESSQVAINVPWWDDAVETIINDLRNQVGGMIPIDYKQLIEQIEQKFTILGIFKDYFSDDDVLDADIKDRLYFHYGNSFIDGGADVVSSELGAKSLVISQLSQKIIDEVKKEAGLKPQPEPKDTKPVAQVNLSTYYDGFEECYERKVAGFHDFGQMLKESVEKIRLEHDNKALDYCLRKIENECGGLRMDGIKKVMDEEEFISLQDYLDNVVNDYLDNATIELNGIKLNGSDKNDKNVLRQAKKLFGHIIVEKLIKEIYNANHKHNVKAE